MSWQEESKMLTQAGIRHEVAAIDSADHVFMQYEWEREAIDRTVAWLSTALSTQT